MFFFGSHCFASKLVSINPVNNGIIEVTFSDGFNDFPDNAEGQSAYYGHPGPWPEDNMVYFGQALNTEQAVNTENWSVKSDDDKDYNTSVQPVKIYRKSKVSSASRVTNEFTLDHSVYLVLPDKLKQGKNYTLTISEKTNSDLSTKSFTFDIFSSDSETKAIHINLAGYVPSFSQIKAADVYLFMGDGGHADYSEYEGNKVIAFNTNTGKKTEVGTLSFWREADINDIGDNKLIKSPVWNSDFSSLNKPGTYRIAIEGIGCSPVFEVGNNVLYDPYKMAVRGYYYMRLGQKDVKNIKPVPRIPLMIPGDESDGYGPTTVYVTTYHPFGNWPDAPGDKWDKADAWADGKTGEVNPNAKGGHSDAFDWDRHHGHVGNIYDILLPYVLLQGKALNDDDLEIAESGDGIPDILQEAQYEIDFWLSLKVSDGYGSGVTNPENHHGIEYTGVLYQAAAHPVMAWQSAAASAMIAECYRLAGQRELQNYYTEKAIEAYTFVKDDEGLKTSIFINRGEAIRGADFKMTAAAYLYNLTGEQKYEDEMKALTLIDTKPEAVLQNIADIGPYNQLYGAIAYMFTNRAVNYPELQSKMKNVIKQQAFDLNVDINKPSRRATVNQSGWGYWQSAQNMQWAMTAHALSNTINEQDTLMKAMLLETSWSMGRNPLNKILMTGPVGTHYLENTYTTGQNDGTPGVHYGHTPYMMHGHDCWWSNATDIDGASGCAQWYTTKGYPEWEQWPWGEGHWNSRYLCPVGEFTPRQTMKGKTALYAYLYGISSLIK